jgi:hypothetical protein
MIAERPVSATTCEVSPTFKMSLTSRPALISATRRWKAEALKAIVQLPGFEDKQQFLSSTMAEELQITLQQCISLSNTDSTKVLTDFCRNCVQLSVKIVTDMACSSQMYDLSHNSRLQVEMSNGNFKPWNLRSVSTWERPKGDVDLSPVILLSPGLYNVTQVGDGSPGVELTKPILVVSEERIPRRRADGVTQDTDKPQNAVPIGPVTAGLDEQVTERKDGKTSRKHHRRTKSRSRESSVQPPNSSRGFSSLIGPLADLLRPSPTPSQPVSPQGNSRRSSLAERSRDSGHRKRHRERDRAQSRHVAGSGSQESHGRPTTHSEDYFGSNEVYDEPGSISDDETLPQDAQSPSVSRQKACAPNHDVLLARRRDPQGPRQLSDHEEYPNVSFYGPNRIYP